MNELTLSQELAIRLAGVLGFALNMLGFVLIQPKLTKLTVAGGSFAWGVQYALLQAHTGMWILLLAGLRQTLSAFTDGLPHRQRLFLALLFGAIAIGFAAFSWSGWLLSAVPVVATLIGTWAFFMLSNTALRQTTLASNALWAAYGYATGSYELLLTMLVLSLATLTGLYRLRLARL
ncbi:YgjV family protein [Limnobacter sp.]|uniref:YgjV family protein n=1 Tax=Limnobacter sp. TaxID=2003368 RepID=UPI0035138B2B